MIGYISDMSANTSMEVYNNAANNALGSILTVDMDAEAALNAAEEVMQMYTTQLNQPDLRVLELESKLQSIEQRLAHSEEKSADGSRRVMLGAAAYMLDKAACVYVFQGEKYRKGMTIAQLDYMAHTKRLSGTQMVRWGKFCKFMQYKGWSVSDVMVTSSVMKGLGKADAHAKEEDKSTVTLVQLESWAETEADAGAVEDCKEFLQLVAAFGDGYHPLVLGQVVQLVDSAPLQ